MPIQQFPAISWWEQVNFQWDDDEISFVLDQQAEFDFYSASSLSQQSADRRVALSDTLFWFRTNQSLLFLLNAACLAEKQQISINFIVFGLTQQGLEPTIYRTQGEYDNHYATDAVYASGTWT